MPWIRVDDHFDEHPKLQRIGPLGWGFWLAGLAYCNRNLTDGFIPWTKARTLCSFELAEEDGTVWEMSRTSGMSGHDVTADWVIGLLIDAGLWEAVRNEKGRVDGYRVHDYEDYQPSAEKVNTEREQTRQRVAAFRNKKNGEFGSNDDVTALHEKSNAVSNADVTPAPYPNPIPTPYPLPSRLPKTRTETTKSESAREKNAAKFPDEFQPPYEWAKKELGMTTACVDAEIPRMRDWALAKGEKRKDWIAFARNWLRKKHDEQPRGSPSNVRPLEPKRAPKSAFHLVHDGERS